MVKDCKVSITLSKEVCICSLVSNYLLMYIWLVWQPYNPSWLPGNSFFLSGPPPTNRCTCQTPPHTPLTSLSSLMEWSLPTFSSMTLQEYLLVSWRDLRWRVTISKNANGSREVIDNIIKDDKNEGSSGSKSAKWWARAGRCAFSMLLVIDVSQWVEGTRDWWINVSDGSRKPILSRKLKKREGKGVVRQMMQWTLMKKQ